MLKLLRDGRDSNYRALARIDSFVHWSYGYDTKNKVKHGNSAFNYAPFAAALSFVLEAIISITMLNIHWQCFSAQSRTLW